MEYSITDNQLFIRPIDEFYCFVSFDGTEWYVFVKDNITPSKWLDKLLYIVENTDNEMIPVSGIYNKKEKVLKLEYDTNLYRLFTLVKKFKSLTETGQTFLMDIEKMKEELIIPIDVKLVAYKEPAVGKLYRIEETKEDTRKFGTGEERRTVGCVVVDYEPLERAEDDKTRYRATLWIPDNKEVAPSGKLGSHLAAFADYFGEEADSLEITLDPKNWKGKVIKIIKWEEKSRMIKVQRDEP